MGLVRRRNTPMVVDADGLWLVNQDPSLVQGEPPALTGGLWGGVLGDLRCSNWGQSVSCTRRGKMFKAEAF